MGAFTRIGTVNDPNNAHTIEGLTHGTTYRARLAYVNTADVQGTLFVHDFTTRAVVETTGLRFGVPAASATFAEGDAVNLQLPAAEGADNITYAIEGALPGGSSFTAATRRIAGTVSAGEAGTYQVILRATNTDDTDDTAAIPVNITVTAAALGAPGAVRNLALLPDETDQDRLGLGWLAPESGGPFDGYEIQYREVDE